ncbi:MAG TPA: peptidoglycan DD-metalloendopeptidase family protein [Acidimicrobiales bacterium]|jgi:murein DD-endopeptidase MepM/ murein hydrolase activator NlpD|nr:peptidoglycan DD-metalloendopeptidase family protein [Acidimicrobiales bacterium]
MRKTSRLPAVAALVLALLVALAAPAQAKTSVSKAKLQRDAARAKKAQLAAKINALKASDGELEGALSVLNRQVSVQQAAADSARQAVQAAMATVAAADARLAETEAQIGTLRGAVVRRAVDDYVRPKATPFGGVIATSDLGEASRRDSLRRQVSDRDRDVVDRLRAAKQDLEEQQAAAAHARDVMAERRQAVLARLSDLQKAQQEKERLSAAVEARIKDYQAEADAVAREESGLVALIRASESQDRASRGGDGGFDARTSAAGLIWPLRGPVTSGFGYRWGKMHAGIDIGVGSGTPIHAAKGGTVILARSMSGYGNYTCIDHGGGFSTCYAHQSRLGVSAGQRVGQGEVIGWSGNTGHSTGPHLHFETRVNGNPQDPRRYLP